MGRSRETFGKKEVRSKKERKRKEKAQKRLDRKEKDKSSKLEDMMAYVDEFGNITTTPPDPDQKKEEINAEDIELGVPKHEEDDDPVRKGVVTFFNDDKGYGFIKDSKTQEKIFVHVNNVLEDIKENNMVTYEVVMGQKGPAATEVKIYKPENKESKESK
ncbi:MAG TPA: DNA-binding protein [Microscillaceae bacterium]|nr:DNA-binding protein [Microscillaceae bacterium]